MQKHKSRFSWIVQDIVKPIVNSNQNLNLQFKHYETTQLPKFHDNKINDKFLSNKTMQNLLNKRQSNRLFKQIMPNIKGNILSTKQRRESNKIENNSISSAILYDQSSKTSKIFLQPPSSKRSSGKSLFLDSKKSSLLSTSSTQQKYTYKMKLPKIQTIKQIKALLNTKRQNCIFGSQRMHSDFMKQFKNRIYKQFKFEIDLKDQDNLKKIQFLLLKQIHLQGEWFLDD